MKALKHWSKLVFGWIDRYKYVIPAFLVGAVFGLLVFAVDMENRDFALAIVTAAGTVGAALAALWTTRLSRETLDRQLSYEQELKQPNLVLSSINIEVGKYTYSEKDPYYNNIAGRHMGSFKLDAQLINLGEFPIYVKEVSSSIPASSPSLSKKGTDDKYDTRGFLLSPNTSVQCILEFPSIIPTHDETVEGQLTVSFQYGPTARKIHFLDLQVSIHTVDADHVLEGELTVKDGDEIFSKQLDIGFNYDHRMRGEHD
jgi:uncharacterized membrane protein